MGNYPFYRDKNYYAHDAGCFHSKGEYDMTGILSIDAKTKLRPCCKRAALIRAMSGAKRDNDVRDLMKWMNEYDVGTNMLERLFYEKKAKLIKQNGRIYIRTKEDIWYIEPNIDTKTGQLYHGNYRMKRGGEKLSQGSYHLQVEGWLPVWILFRTIVNHGKRKKAV
ncbi:MAG: hypothetical protein LUE86_11410 [Clostridiales bacterium]|nr:hypothetical protein [Clostridiales bacterium]